MLPLHEENYLGHNLKIYQDEDPQNPIKDWDVLGKLVCFHSDYDLGNRHDFNTPDDALAHFKETKALYRPLYLLDHSGLSMCMGRDFSDCDPGSWDSGQIGWIFITREDALKELDKKILTQAGQQQIYKMLACTVNTYDQYLRGDVYGFVTEDVEGETIESVWGFYGFDYCLEETKETIDYHVKRLAKTHKEKLIAQIRNKVPLQYRVPCPI